MALWVAVHCSSEFGLSTPRPQFPLAKNALTLSPDALNSTLSTPWSISRPQESHTKDHTRVAYDAQESHSILAL